MEVNVTSYNVKNVCIQYENRGVFGSKLSFAPRKRQFESRLQVIMPMTAVGASRLRVTRADAP